MTVLLMHQMLMLGLGHKKPADALVERMRAWEMRIE